MSKLLKLEFAVVMLLLLIAILVRVNIAASEPDTGLQAPAASTGSTADPEIQDPETPPPTTLPPQTQPPTTLPPEPVFLPEEGIVQCQDYFVYDCEKQQFLTFSQDLNAPVYPASITKLFTAYVALQYLDPDAVLTAGEEQNFLEPNSSIAYIFEGYKLSVSMLVEGMLLPSGNDAAYLLAAAAGRAHGGEDLSAASAVAHFVEMMNAEAEKLGMAGSHFTNPDGYHDPDHYTCYADLATIAHLALDTPLIAQYAATHQESVVYASGHTNTWTNTNRLLDPQSQYYCPDAIGLKTGNTEEAGSCLLSAFDAGDRVLVVGVFGCSSTSFRFRDTLTIYELAKNYQ